MINLDVEWWAALPPSGFEVDTRIVLRGRGFPLIRRDVARCIDPDCRWREDGEEHAHEVLALPTVGTGEANPKPGHYYVSVGRGDSFRLLRGPYTWHHEALAAVPAARDEAQEIDPRSIWYAFGTCRAPRDMGPGILDVDASNAA